MDALRPKISRVWTSAHENPPVEATTNADSGSGEKSPPADVEPAPQPALLPDEGSEDSESDKYLHGMPLILMALSLMIGVLTVALDNSIISTAIPKMTSQFNSLSDVPWYGTIYLLSQMSFQPTFGKMYTFFNLKWIYLGAGVLFEVGSIICAAAPNSAAFILGRAVAGFGASGLYCGSMIIITQIVEMRKRPLFLGIISSMFGVASVIGPALGGVFTHSERLTWRFCFWINLPLGGLTGAIICFYYPSTLGGAVNKDRPLKQKLLGLGLKSAVVLTATLVCLFLALQWGGTVYPWRDSRVWGCLLGFGFLLILFSYIQVRQKEDALIPLRILSQRSVLLGCLFSCLLQGAMMTQAYHLPFYFQAVKGDDPQESGINILPHGVTVSIATLISGTCMTLSGYYVPFMWFGAALFTTGGGLLYTLSQTSSIGRWFGFQLMAGAGYGTTVQIPIFAIQVVLSTADIPLGTTMVIIAQSFGGAVGLAIAQNVFQNFLSQELNKIKGIDVAAVVAAGGVELEKVVPGSLLALVRDAFQVAIANAFLVAVGLGGVAFLASLGMERKRINKSKSS
ncbi:hypothetical protein LCI18_001965 [Fusarium solani-melongenae]|uniref:Uncharacterized protein n=1 Tax=Fusarium solani subsp. cucurbitae TaxID=2747967 RepID=A0ACD3YQ67_FUSSC|nr:hypothetical protein LCI18_001965 [Fusarium solani-melongenae]